jgi:hypothetical protein
MYLKKAYKNKTFFVEDNTSEIQTKLFLLLFFDAIILLLPYSLI